MDRRSWRAGALAAAGMLAAACASAPSVGGRAPHAEEELFILMVDAGREAVLIERATEGAVDGAPAPLREAGELESAAGTLHAAVLDLYRLRALTCASGLVGGGDCGPLPPPAWLGEPPGAPADADEIARRLEWLRQAAEPFVDAGCGAGESRRTDEDAPPFCSVE